MALNGIDISNWQSGINLAVVPCDFVVIKATEGTGYVIRITKEPTVRRKQQGNAWAFITMRLVEIYRRRQNIF